MEVNIYEDCCIKNDRCGPNTRGKKLTATSSVSELNTPVDNHFCYLKLSYDKKQWNEQTLIENRLGRKLIGDEKLCAYHRYVLCIYCII